MFPFKEKVISDKRKIRTFKQDVSNEELVWHRDARDRHVKILQSSGWFFQMDDQLPFALKPGDQVVIPKATWHRIIRKNCSEDLVVEITEE